MPVQPRQRIVIYGASGAVGTAAVQLAKCFGAEVTGACSSSNIELVKALGANKVIDYTREDFSKSGELYDIIFDAVGKISKSSCLKSLAPSGAYVSVEGQGVAKERNEGLLLLKELVEAGRLMPVIDRYYRLEQIPDAHRYVDKGHKKGNVVIVLNRARNNAP